jgi:hypothetical protein
MTESSLIFRLVFFGGILRVAAFFALGMEKDNVESGNVLL